MCFALDVAKDFILWGAGRTLKSQLMGLHVGTHFDFKGLIGPWGVPSRHLHVLKPSGLGGDGSYGIANVLSDGDPIG